MFERFTDRARRVVVNAQDESRNYNHPHIGSEHLLLGVIRDANSLGARVLASFGLTQEGVRKQVEETIVRGEDAPGGHIPFTAEAKAVLELALQEAKHLGHGYIGTEHILLGLIRNTDGLAARILDELDVDLERTRAEVRKHLVAGASAGGPRDPNRIARLELQIAALTDRLAAVERRLDG